VREKIDELVHKEVQLKLNNIQDSIPKGDEVV